MTETSNEPPTVVSYGVNASSGPRTQKLESNRGVSYRSNARPSRGDIFASQPYDHQTKAAHRTSICPFLLRVFVKIGGQGSGEEVDTQQTDMRVGCSEEFQVYAWMNDSLREVVNLIKDIVVEARDPRAKLKLQRRCYETNVLVDMGVVSSTFHSATDRRTLRSFSFEIGDTIDLTIEPHSKKSIAPRNPMSDKKDDKEDHHEEIEGDYDQGEDYLPEIHKDAQHADEELASESTCGPSSSQELPQNIRSDNKKPGDEQTTSDVSIPVVQEEGKHAS